MKKIILCAALCSLSLHATAESQFGNWQQWLQQLPELLDERTQTSTEYLQNYLQCMDDQQALRNESEANIRELLQDALESGNECVYLLEGLVDDLIDKENRSDNSSETTPETAPDKAPNSQDDSQKQIL